jgi:hypothetical protein
MSDFVHTLIATRAAEGMVSRVHGMGMTIIMTTRASGGSG